MYTTIAHAALKETLEARYFDTNEPQARSTTETSLRKRTLAIAALICAVLGVTVLPLIPAIVLGHYVLATTDDDAPLDDHLTEVARGYAWAALVVGYVSLGVVLIGLLLR